MCIRCEQTDIPPAAAGCMPPDFCLAVAERREALAQSINGSLARFGPGHFEAISASRRDGGADAGRARGPGERFDGCFVIAAFEREFHECGRGGKESAAKIVNGDAVDHGGFPFPVRRRIVRRRRNIYSCDRFLCQRFLLRHVAIFSIGIGVEIFHA